MTGAINAAGAALKWPVHAKPTWMMGLETSAQASPRFTVHPKILHLIKMGFIIKHLWLTKVPVFLINTLTYSYYLQAFMI